jgi:hypothetical protein
MATNITLKEHKVIDFVSIENGTELVGLTSFKGRLVAGTPGWADEICFTPDQAEEVGKELIRRAQAIRSEKLENERSSK